MGKSFSNGQPTPSKGEGGSRTSCIYAGGEGKRKGGGARIFKRAEEETTCRGLLVDKGRKEGSLCLPAQFMPTAEAKQEEGEKTTGERSSINITREGEKRKKR